MAYRCGNRYQMDLMPPSIEEYVAQDNPVRVYDAFVESLDFRELGIEINPGKVGNSEYKPQSMFKLLVYGYSYGVKSSRKLERECHHNMAFIWLMGGLRPDHKTIAEFRRRNRHALQKMLRQCARMCIKFKLIAGNVLFLDGTKIRANAGRDSSHDRAYYEKLLKKLDGRIKQLLEDCEAADRSEEGASSYVAMDKELAKSQNLKDRIKEALSFFASGDRQKVNQTDPDCAIMHSLQGTHAAYNVQSVVDDQHGLILQVEAVTDTNDALQFSRQIEQANEVLGKSCEVACADAGYSDVGNLEEIDAQQIKVIVPSQRQALHEEEGPFSKSHFTYDLQQDCYFCPEGYRLRYSYTNTKNGKRQYRIEDKNLCHHCPHYGQCTKADWGRSIIRLRNEEVKLKLEAQYEESSSQDVYARRKTRVEHPFGHIKRNLKTDSFLLRGLEGVQAETSLLATCFNVARIITILGVGKLIDKLSGLKMVPVCC
ncbi:MAG: IS1182 family transposase [Syntrophaceae bacterium]|nr:IS1182 family transposase [Syntrophaceae bacterium]